MFGGARNFVVNGSTFVANAESSSTFSDIAATRKTSLSTTLMHLPGSIIQPLLDRVSMNAILNAGGRADEVGCYPGTRDMVIGKLERWMDGKSEPNHRMFWLSGPAGAGKSAIMQTVAERRKKRRSYAPNFFFFRDDGTRNNSQPLVATLVYQLLNLYPPLRGHLQDCLTAKPLTYKASTEEQFMEFISSPFEIIRQSSSADPPIILIIDGLDECNDEKEQVRILESLHALVAADNSPFRVLVASRTEHQLQTFFNQRRTSVESIFLDGTYGPEDDIRRFVVAKFDKIKQSHPLSHRLSEDWPTEADVDAIVSKSSGQFIYAATVMRFIEHSSGSPALSLRSIYEVQLSAGNNPLAHLHALYSYVFSRAHNLQTVKLIICAHFIIEAYQLSQISMIDLGHLMQLLGHEAIEIESHFADLTAIVQVTTAPCLALVFYHASLPDYLKNKSQSEIYHVDTGEIATELSLLCLTKFHDYESFNYTILVLSYVRMANTELSDSLLNASKRQFTAEENPIVFFVFLPRTIEELYFETDRVMFKRLLQSWVYFAYIHRISLDVSDVFVSPTAKLYFKWCVTKAKAKSTIGLLSK